MIDTYLLEHLVAFKKHRTLSEAAQALHLTQPTLTRSMHKLEEEFGVKLFEREKKRLYLNETGKVAAEYAENILRMQETMEEQVRLTDRRHKTITVGSCAPGPLLELTPKLTAAFTQMAISTEMADEQSLLTGLNNKTYQMIILTHPLEDELYYSKHCGSEQLCACLVSKHKYAYENSVTFAQMNGESFLMVSEVGIWDAIVRKHMPQSKFLLLSGSESLIEVADTSSLPTFSTDLSIRILGMRRHRFSIPFADEDAHMDFYCICLKSEYQHLAKWFKQLS